MNPLQDALRFKRRLIAALVFVLVLFGVVAYYEHVHFHVVSTNPHTSNVTDYTPFFKVDFSQPVVSKGIVVKGNPGNIIKSYSASGKILTIMLNYPLQRKTNTITIVTITSKSGKTIKNKSFSFKPTDIANTTIPDDQQKVLINGQDENQGASSDPIVQDLPYTTPNIDLTANISAGPNGSDVLTLEATLYLNEADMSDEQAAVATYKNQVITYISSLGLNASNYNIQYTISTP